MNARPGCLRDLRRALVVVASLALCGCVRFHIMIDVDSNGSGMVGAALGLTAQAKAVMESQGIGDPSGEIRSYLEREANVSEAAEERWTDGEYDWVAYRIPFDDLNELNSRMSETEFFESFIVSADPGLVNTTFSLDARLSPAFLEAQMPDDLDFDLTQVVDLRLAVSLPGELTETNGRQDPKHPDTAWWRIETGPSIPIHAVSELREARKTGGVTPAPIVAIAGAAAAAIIGLGVYKRQRQRG